jgi:hypothetical protein
MVANNQKNPAQFFSSQDQRLKNGIAIAFISVDNTLDR